jgi:DNA-binding sugar fermentation-stimulating protein
MRELTRIANGELVHVDPENAAGTAPERYKATILFVVIRGDAESFRPNVQACPSFGRYLRLAEQAGVEILVKRVSWAIGERKHVLTTNSCPLSGQRDINEHNIRQSN